MGQGGLERMSTSLRVVFVEKGIALVGATPTAQCLLEFC